MIVFISQVYDQEGMIRYPKQLKEFLGYRKHSINVNYYLDFV